MSIRKQYDSDLEALRVALVEMGQNAAEAVENALEALCTADTAAAQKIVQGDDRINNMERDIEHRCMTLLLRQQPVAGDLRHISAAMKVEELMNELKKNYTVVIVTHNMQQAARISDRTAFFLLGELVEVGPTNQIFSTPRDKRTEDYITGRFG